MSLSDSQVLRQLHRISGQLEALREDNREIKTGLGNLEQQVVSLSSCMDRMELRLDRIERRLELVDA